ncbi:hypothetical protein D3C86_1361510 [compost metagenome]
MERAGLLGAAVERGPSQGAVGVCHVALRVIARAAVRAGAAGDRRGNHHAIAHVQVAHLRTQLLDDPDALVAEDRPGLHPGHGSPDHVQVRPADRAGGQPNDGIGRLLDLGIGDLVEPNVSHPVKHDGFHLAPPVHYASRRFQPHTIGADGVKTNGRTSDFLAKRDPAPVFNPWSTSLSSKRFERRSALNEKEKKAPTTEAPGANSTSVFKCGVPERCELILTPEEKAALEGEGMPGPAVGAD